MAEAATTATPEREAEPVIKAEAGNLAAARVTAFEARRNAVAPYAQANRLAAQAAAATADWHAEPSLLAAPNGADLIT